MSQVVEASLISYIFSKIYKTIININIKHYYYPRKKKRTQYFFFFALRKILISSLKRHRIKNYIVNMVFFFFLFLRYGLNFQLYFNFFLFLFLVYLFLFIFYSLFMMLDPVPIREKHLYIQTHECTLFIHQNFLYKIKFEKYTDIHTHIRI